MALALLLASQILEALASNCSSLPKKLEDSRERNTENEKQLKHQFDRVQYSRDGHVLLSAIDPLPSRGQQYIKVVHTR